MAKLDYETALGKIAAYSVDTREKLNQMTKQRRNSVYDVYGLERTAIGSKDTVATFFVPITPDLDKIIRWEFKLRIDAFSIPLDGNGVTVMPATVNVDPAETKIKKTNVENVPSEHSHEAEPHTHSTAPHSHNIQVSAGVQLVQPNYTTIKIYIDNIDFTDLFALQFPLPKGMGIFPDDTLSNRYDIVEACQYLKPTQRDGILQAGFHRVELKADGVYSASMIEFIKYSSINRHGNTSDPQEVAGLTAIHSDIDTPNNPVVNQVTSAYQQVVTPNLSVSGIAGMCLEYVDDSINAPARQDDAQLSWNAAVSGGNAHSGDNPPVGVWTPIYFAVHNGRWAGMGHIAWYYSDGTTTQIYDSNVRAGLRGIYKSISELITWMGWDMVYLGWSEVVDGLRVIRKADKTAHSTSNGAIESDNMTNGNSTIDPKYAVVASSRYDLVMEKTELEQKLTNLSGSKAYIFTETAKIKTLIMQIEATLQKLQVLEELKGETNEL